MPPHVLRLDSLGRALIVRTARRVHVVIAGEPVHRRHVNPALELESLMMGLHPGHRDGPDLRLVLGPARVLNLKSSGRKRHALATVAINLGVEEEVRRQPAAERGINPSHPVPEMNEAIVGRPSWSFTSS